MPVSILASFANPNNLEIKTASKIEDGKSIFDTLVEASSYRTFLDLVTSDTLSSGTRVFLRSSLTPC